jgi:hypothetical protein
MDNVHVESGVCQMCAGIGNQRCPLEPGQTHTPQSISSNHLRTVIRGRHDWQAYITQPYRIEP